VVSFKARASSTHARRLKDETENKHVEGDMAATKIKLTLFLATAFLAMAVVAEQVQGQTGPESQPELPTTLQPLRADVNGDEIIARLDAHNEMRKSALRDYTDLRTYQVIDLKGRVHAEEIGEMEFHAPEKKTFVVTF